MSEIKTFDERKEELLKKGKENGFLTFEELAEALKGLGYKASDINKITKQINPNDEIEIQIKEALKLLLK